MNQFQVYDSIVYRLNKDTHAVINLQLEYPHYFNSNDFDRKLYDLDYFLEHNIGNLKKVKKFQYCFYVLNFYTYLEINRR